MYPADTRDIISLTPHVMSIASIAHTGADEITQMEWRLSRIDGELLRRIDEKVETLSHSELLRTANYLRQSIKAAQQAAKPATAVPASSQGGGHINKDKAYWEAVTELVYGPVGAPTHPDTPRPAYRQGPSQAAIDAAAANAARLGQGGGNRAQRRANKR